MASSSSAEEWRPVADFPGYEVSNLGRLRSLPQLVRCKGDATRGIDGQILKTPIRGAGYPCVCIRKVNLLVHREVAKAFLGPPPFPDAEVNHKDGDKANPILWNLEWVTSSENQRHSFRELGRISLTKGKFSADHGTSIPVVATCMKTGRTTRYEAAIDAVRDGFDSGGISRACAGHCTHHRGHTWRYADGHSGRTWSRE